MTPKEKADELIDKMYYIGRYDDKEDYNPTMAWERGKQCALIAVDEILNNNSKILGLLTQDTMHNTWFWQEVKEEIEKL
jgi:hypothetical protein